MPTYEYECGNGHKILLLRSVTARDFPQEPCRACGGKMRRIPAVVAGIHFKGSGFYATDYPKEAR